MDGFAIVLIAIVAAILIIAVLWVLSPTTPEKEQKGTVLDIVQYRTSRDCLVELEDGHRQIMSTEGHGGECVNVRGEQVIVKTDSTGWSHIKDSVVSATRTSGGAQ